MHPLRLTERVRSGTGTEVENKDITSPGKNDRPPYRTHTL